LTNRELPPEPPPLSEPIFIGGAGRSGTTLMRALLDAHPRICCGPEFRSLPEISRLYWTMAVANQAIQQAYGNTPADLALQCRRYIEGLTSHFRRAAAKPRWAEKTPDNVLCMLGLGEIFPDARFIHMIRDGRDVACSLVTMTWRNPITGAKEERCQSIANAARYWCDVVRAGQRQTADPRLTGRVLIVLYEMLVAKPEATLRQVLQFLGESWDPAVLSYWQKDRTHEPLEASRDQIARPVYTSAVGRWRTEMSPVDRALFEAEAGDLLRELGYAKEGWQRQEAGV